MSGQAAPLAGRFETLPTGAGETRCYVAGDDATGSGDRPGILLFHPWWGLVPDITAYADRLAAEGFVVAAPDCFFGRTATTPEDAESLAGGADPAAVDAVADAALAALLDRLAPSARAAAIGFSFGAHWALRAPTVSERVPAVVLYYGTTGGPLLERARGALLGHYAANDPFEETAWVDEFATTLRAAGCEVQLERYPGTGHWFAEPSQDAYRPEAAVLALQRTLAFLRARLAG